jgi:hypothetical protein
LPFRFSAYGLIDRTHLGLIDFGVVEPRLLQPGFASTGTGTHDFDDPRVAARHGQKDVRVSPAAVASSEVSGNSFTIETGKYKKST